MKKLLLAAIDITISACNKPHKLKEFEYPDKIDTSDHPINPQDKRAYTIMGDDVTADNLFDAARMNDFSKIITKILKDDLKKEITVFDVGCFQYLQKFPLLLVVKNIY